MLIEGEWRDSFVLGGLPDNAFYVAYAEIIPMQKPVSHAQEHSVLLSSLFSCIAAALHYKLTKTAPHAYVSPMQMKDGSTGCGGVDAKCSSGWCVGDTCQVRKNSGLGVYLVCAQSTSSKLRVS